MLLYRLGVDGLAFIDVYVPLLALLTIDKCTSITYIYKIILKYRVFRSHVGIRRSLCAKCASISVRIDLDAIPANAQALILVSPQTIDEPANKHSVNSSGRLYVSM